MLGRFIRFAGAGTIGTLVHYGVLVMLVELVAIPAAIATACGAVAGAGVNYVLNYRVTFRSTASHFLTGPRFALIAIAGLVLNSAIVFLFVQLGAHYLLGQVTATAVVLLAGFLANHFWTFSETKHDAQ